MIMLLNNIGTIVVALVLLVIITAIIFKIRKDKKGNKCAGCPCGCAASGAPLKKSASMEKPTKKMNFVV
jgi:hypothetical protein